MQFGSGRKSDCKVRLTLLCKLPHQPGKRCAYSELLELLNQLAKRPGVAALGKSDRNFVVGCATRDLLNNPACR